jgi:hypothetical protein
MCLKNAHKVQLGSKKNPKKFVEIRFTKKLTIDIRLSQNKQRCVNKMSKNVYWQIKITWKKLQINQ